MCLRSRSRAEFRRRRGKSLPPPAAASRILVGAPARQPYLVRASRKSGGGAAEGLLQMQIDPVYILWAKYYRNWLTFVELQLHSYM